MDHVGTLLQGVGNGGVFAALALALVITYRASGVVNFATGAVALYIAYTYAGLRKGELLILVPGLPQKVDIGGELGTFPATVVSLIIAAALGALLYLLVFRPLRDATPMAKAVASLGVLVVLQGLLAIRQGTNPVSVADIFPAHRWEVGGATVLSDRVFLAVAVVVLAVVLAAAFRFTRFGLLTRASAETQVGAVVSGVSPDRVALANWMISAVVAGVAGILIAPVTPLTPVTYTLFVVPALAAAVVGRFQHLTVIVAAGIGIGMLQSEAQSLALDHDWLPPTGLSELVPLAVILVALVVVQGGMPLRGSLVRERVDHVPRPRSLVFPAVAGLVVGAAALLLTSGSWRAAVISSTIFAIIGLSFVVVTGYAGQVSLAQLALAGTAAFTLSGLTESWGVPFPLAPLLAASVATVIGVLIGLPALRLRGLTLGVVTLAFAYAIEAVWFRNPDIVGTSGTRITSPSLFGLDLGIGSGRTFPRIEFGLVCLVTLVVVALGVAVLRRSPLGSAMLAVRANERSAAASGVNVVRVKVLSFALASFIAGLGGSLLAYRQGIVSYEPYTAIGGLVLLTTVYLAGVTSVWGGLNAGLLAGSGVMFYAVDSLVDIGDWFGVVSGVLLIVTLIAHPEGVASIGHKLADRGAALLAGRRSSASVDAVELPTDPADPAADGSEDPSEDRTDEPVPAPPPSGSPESTPAPAAPPPAPAGAAAANGAGGLVVDQLKVQYGGVVAVNQIDLQVEPGTIVGLIGPNGAGKTSVVDAVTGFAPATGAIGLAGRPLATLAPHNRVRAGLGRTFQSLELYDDLSVEENVSVATVGRRRVSNGRGDRRAAVSRALDQAGISGLRDRVAGELSQGERQLVSIARACVADPRVLLLDEPAAGLDTTESAWLGERIRSIAAVGTGVLLVDHDVALVLGICDHVYVLDFGNVIAAGPPSAIRADRAVADAYLGTLNDTEAVTA